MPHQNVRVRLRRSKALEVRGVAQPAFEGGEETEEEVSMEGENGATSQVQVV